MIEEFRRTEIEATSTATDADVEQRMGALFEDPGPTRKVDPAATSQEQERVEKRNKFLQTTQRIKDEKTFVAFTPESEQILVAELRLLRHLHAQNMWARANDSWITGVLPVGALIHIMPLKVYTFVFKANACAAITWPAEEVAPRVWRTKKTWNQSFGVAHRFQRR